MSSTHQFLQSLIDQNHFVLGDGALGTNFFNMGLTSGDSPEIWNIEQPEKVAKVHQDFLRAGANILTTNSFGGSSYRLKLHGAEDRVAIINEQAAAIARAEIDASPRSDVIIAGSIGPTGEILAPHGEVTIRDAADAFLAQAIALKKGGADILWAETMSSKEEVIAASMAAFEADIDFAFTMTFDTNGKTMMGVDPKDVMRFIDEMPRKPVAVGLNCGRSPYESMVSLYHLVQENHYPEIYIIAQANRGVPSYKNGAFIFDGTHEIMAHYANIAYDLGARIIGGCCGTDEATLACMQSALQQKNYDAVQELSLDDIYDILGQGQEKLTITTHKKRSRKR